MDIRKPEEEAVDIERLGKELTDIQWPRVVDTGRQSRGNAMTQTRRAGSEARDTQRPVSEDTVT